MSRKPITAWLALFRLPNLFTTPGDPLAGALLAGAALGTGVACRPTALAAGAALCLYACGVVANDVLGADEDARERPDRPIPSGRISRRAAFIAAVLLNAAGLGCAMQAGMTALAVGVVLSLCVWAYNLKARSMAGVRPFVMGACRGLSLLLGAATLGPAALLTPPTLSAAAGLTLGVAVITAIARHEVGPEEGSRIPPWLLAALPLILLAMLAVLNTVIWIGGIPLLAIPPLGFPLLAAAMAVTWAAIWCGVLFGRPGPSAVRASIGNLVRGLLLIQAALCGTVGHPGEAVALGLLAAFAVSSWVGKWIQGS